MGSARKKCIMLVDDERDIADAITALRDKYFVETYGNPAEALRAYKIGFYDLILLDYRMPVMDGRL